MYNPTALTQRRCACTLPFSLHLTVMILGLVGVILGIVIVAVYFHIGNLWALASGALAFASGLQGVLVHNDPGSRCYNCHAILAVINLVNLAVFGVSCLFLISPFWVIWAIAAFAMELWITIVSYCCKKGVGTTTGASMELPTAQPNGVHVVQGHPANGAFESQGYASEPQGGFKQPYMP